jgi:hypothetical protein
MLFAKLGLNYDVDVPQKIKDQLERDENSKQILVNLTKKFEKGDFSRYVDKQREQQTKKIFQRERRVA